MTRPASAITTLPAKARACEDTLCPDCELQIVLDDAAPWCCQCARFLSWDDVSCPYPAFAEHTWGDWLCPLHAHRLDAIIGNPPTLAE
jgi:hypothetical protein